MLWQCLKGQRQHRQKQFLLDSKELEHEPVMQLWRLREGPDGDIEADFLSSITGDKCESGYKTWNCVRFSPTGSEPQISLMQIASLQMPFRRPPQSRKIVCLSIVSHPACRSACCHIFGHLFQSEPTHTVPVRIGL